MHWSHLPPALDPTPESRDADGEQATVHVGFLVTQCSSSWPQVDAQRLVRRSKHAAMHPFVVERKYTNSHHFLALGHSSPPTVSPTAHDFNHKFHEILSWAKHTINGSAMSKAGRTSSPNLASSGVGATTKILCWILCFRNMLLEGWQESTKHAQVVRCSCSELHTAAWFYPHLRGRPVCLQLACNGSITNTSSNMPNAIYNLFRPVKV